MLRETVITMSDHALPILERSGAWGDGLGPELLFRTHYRPLVAALAVACGNRELAADCEFNSAETEEVLSTPTSSRGGRWGLIGTVAFVALFVRMPTFSAPHCRPKSAYFWLERAFSGVV